MLTMVDGLLMEAVLVSQHTITCVLVDDHEVVRAGTRARLEANAWIEVVGEASSSAEAFQLIESLRPQLALVDVRMPDEDGLQLAQRLRALGTDTRVVLYSGVASTTQAEQALEAGAFGFVLKDSPLANVVDALTAARDGRRYIDPTIAAELLSPSDGPRLSAREREILQLVANGGQNASIAFELGISIETVKAHISNILGKFDATSRTEAVAQGIRQGLIR